MIDDRVEPGPIDPPSDLGKARIANRLLGEFILATLKRRAPIFHSDFTLEIVAREIIAANTAHLNDGAAPPFQSLLDTPDDGVRRPVTVFAIAQALHMPYETARRHVKKLEAMGFLRRLKAGVIITKQALEDPRHEKALLEDLARVRQLFQDLKRVEAPMDL